jgi:hypothetical protein
MPGGPWFVKDGQIHWGMQPVRRADVATFRPLSEYWGRDAVRVYCAGSEMRGADPETFRVLNTLYAKDSHSAYTLKGSIAGADARSFEAVGPTLHAFNTDNGYARDCRSVYHTTVGGKAVVVKGADAASFTPCGHGYAADRYAVYFERKKLAGADPAAWQHLRGPHSRSGRNAYVLGRRIRGADGNRLESLPILEGNEYWSRDRTGYYRWGQPADPGPYQQALRECFIFRGRVSRISLTWGRTNPLPPDEAESWAVAEHAWIDVVCGEWVQKPDIEVVEVPKVGAPFRFGEALHLALLSPPSWAAEDRVWIFRPVQDHSRVEKRLELARVGLWWEYGGPDQVGAIRKLVEAVGPR